MPELPQMQALAERLAAAVGDTRLRSSDALQFAALKTVAPAPDEVAGRDVTGVTSHGKYLVFELGGPRILVHLSQAGRVTIEEPPSRSRPKRGVVRFRFEHADGTDAPAVLVLEYGTERKARWWVLAEGDDGPLAQLGPQPGTDAFEAFILGSDDNRRLHTVLRDQRTVSGLGRGYTDDVLHRAGLSPFVSLSSLDEEQRQTVLEAIDAVLARGLEHERARQGGLPPKLGDHWLVHGRYGEPCPTCGEELHRVSYESYEITYCPACQTDGKVLADRRLSRLLK